MLLERYLAEPWNVAALAETVGMPCSSFAQQFAAKTGQSPIAMLMAQGQRLLGASSAGGWRTAGRHACGVRRGRRPDNQSSTIGNCCSWATYWALRRPTRHLPMLRDHPCQAAVTERRQ